VPAPAHFLLFAFLPEQEVEERMRSWFAKFASWVAEAAGSSWAFVLAIVVVAVWALTGPIFGFSDTWQLVINTGTTIVTFLMVFLIQNTQNRDTKAMHLKLDELLRATRGARQDKFADLEHQDEKEVEHIRDALLEECGVCAEAHKQHNGRAPARRRVRR
jgi:low affinity Fe/Cu permease